ncbi:MAG: O-antigen ligase family protein [Caldilineaceae bacterium]|nr:O-antigen ligase family protein [Caldilineaceae bacterium]
MGASEARQFAWEAPPLEQRPRRRPKVRWSLDQFLDPLALAVTAPMALFPERFPPPAMLIGLAILFVPYGVRQVNAGRMTARTAALWPLLFLLLVALPVGAYASPAFWAVSWPELVRAVWGAAVCLGVINFCAAGGSWPSRRSVKPHVAWATAGFLGVGAILGVLGLLAMGANDKLPVVGDLARGLTGALGGLGQEGLNPNRVAGTVLLMVTPATLLTLAPQRDRRIAPAVWGLGRVGLLGLAAFFGGVLLLSQSRTALLAAAGATTLACLLAGRRGWVLLGVAVLMGLAVLSVFGPQRVLDVIAIKRDAETAPGAGVWATIAADEAMAGRRMIWARAWHGVIDAPLTGVGLGAFHLLAQQPYPALPNYRPDPDTTHAHNLALQTALDVGVPGLLAYAAVVFLAAAAALRLLLHSAADSAARLWAAGMVGALLAFLIFNSLDAMTLGARPAVTHWLLLGLVLGADAGMGAR